MTNERTPGPVSLEDELSRLTAAAPADSPLWAAALEASGHKRRTAWSVLGKPVPKWLPLILLALVAGVVLVSVAQPGSEDGLRRGKGLVGGAAATYRVNTDQSQGVRADLKELRAEAALRSAPPTTDRARSTSDASTQFQLVGVTGESATATPPPLSQPPPSGVSRSLAPDRHVIRKASIDLTTKDDVRLVFMKAQQIVSEAGGEYIENAAITGAEERTLAVLTLRVAAARLGEVLGRLRELGHVVSENITGEDVTDRVVDLEARLRNEQRIERELLELIDKRPDAPLKELLEVRQHLANVRQSIEQLVAQRERLGRLVALATILVSIRPESAPTVEPRAAGIGGYFVDQIRDAWETSLRFLADTAAFLVRVIVGGAVWWLVVAIVGATLWNWSKRRMRAGAHEPAPTA